MYLYPSGIPDFCRKQDPYTSLKLKGHGQDLCWKILNYIKYPFLMFNFVYNAKKDKCISIVSQHLIAVVLSEMR